VFSVHLVAFR